MRTINALLFCLLMITMSLSGCFGGDDDSNGSSSSDVQSEGTTIVNNYYNYTTINYENNTTSTTTDNSQPSDPTDIDNYYTNQTYDDYNYNNYSYTNNTNNTITNYSSTGPEMFAIGGSAPPSNGRQESQTDIVWVLNSSAGEALRIIEAYPVKSLHEASSSAGYDYPGMRISSSCNGLNFFTLIANPHEAFAGGVYLQPDFILPGSFTSCQHSIHIYAPYTSWSMVYSVNNVRIG